MLLEEARANTMVKLEQGSSCPCCAQWAQKYRRPLYSSMAKQLILFYKFAKEHGFLNYYHLRDVFGGCSGGPVGYGDFYKFAHWGFIEPLLEQPTEDKKSIGKWRITEKGCQFARKKFKCPKYVWIYNGATIEFDGEQIDIEDALAKKFSYSEIMGVDDWSDEDEDQMELLF